MANGWAPDGAVQDQIDDTVKDAVSAARARMPAGEGTDECEECGEEIPAKRRTKMRRMPRGFRHAVNLVVSRERDAARDGRGLRRSDIGERGQCGMALEEASDALLAQRAKKA